MGKNTIIGAKFTGYDGNGYSVGDRVELHPACDLWMMGARYGTVSAHIGRNVAVSVDKLPNKVMRAAENMFRKV